jgi:hypothetical protein
LLLSSRSARKYPGYALLALAHTLYTPPSGNRVLSILNLAENYFGDLVLPAGWTEEDYDDDDEEEVYRHTDGREQRDRPGKPEGIIAIANAIPDMGAMMSLNLASNDLGVEGAKFIAAVLTKCT